MQAVLGLVFGPLAYWTGAKMGAAELPGGASSLLAIAAAWALAFPTVMLLAAAISPRPARLDFDHGRSVPQKGM